MNWDAAGAIGEIVGAIAVVISLIYLGSQIRQNSRTVAANTVQSISSNAADRLFRVAESPHLSVMMAKVISGEGDLSPEENVQFQMLLRATFRSYENYYYQQQTGNIDPRIWAGLERTIEDNMGIPMFRDWWRYHRGTFSEEFAEYIDRKIVEVEHQSSSWSKNISAEAQQPPNESLETDT